MTQEEYKERYLKFMRDYAAQLPADLSTEERQKQTLAAAEEYFEQDMEAQVEQTKQDLDHIYDEALVEGDKQNAASEEEQLAAVRQSF